MFVRTSGTRFLHSNQPFYAFGVNCYFLGFCSEVSRRRTLLAAKELGATTIRSWAFLDAEERTPGAPAFQYFADGQIRFDDGPDGLERLDALILAAEELNLHLVLPFINHWPDFGGMPLYLKWLGVPGKVVEFYRSPVAREAYKNWVEHLLTRRNTLTGRFYAEEPAVMAWELANEPRSDGAHGDDLLRWIDEMSRFVKSFDPNHLVAAGDEGFFRKLSRSHLYNGTHGVDFHAILELPAIDFGTFHMYPQFWNQRDCIRFAAQWISDHISAGRAINKPVLLEEFGLKENAALTAFGSRDEIYSRWLRQIQEEDGAGALFWMLGHAEGDTEGFRDAFTILSGDNLPATREQLRSQQGWARTQA
jgi:mannan endo-1,4-beta-mannosidase